jgi:ESS family glutamate:Na+ symporter
MPETVVLNELHTLIIALIALGVGATIVYRIPGMRRMGLPISVVGGILVALLVALIRSSTGIEVEFANQAREAFLLVFFTTIGLQARISALREGGKALAILCGVVVGLLVVQNLIGIIIAVIRGAHPFYGLLIGSLSFVGGPGTALAWAMEGKTMGLSHTAEVALGSATLATFAGALVAPQLTNWLIRRNKLVPQPEEADIPWKDEAEVPQGVTRDEFRQKHIAVSLLLVLVAVAIGHGLNDWARSVNMPLPGFLTAMMAGMLIANLGSLFGKDFSSTPLDRAGAFTLQLFLALSLMGLQLWVVAPLMGPLLLNVVLQIVLTAICSIVILFRLLGRDYDAAVTVGGFMGFGLASVPVAFATMEEVTSRFGASPRAFLLITLAASFFVDLANAAVTKAYLLLPMFN